jgi:hypothetical protein
MGNSMTDQLLLAKKTYAPGIFLFQYRLQATADTIQVVFRGDECRGVVKPNIQKGQGVKVRQGDIIIHVYVAPRSYVIAGTITTRDKYKRVYEIPVVLTASEPRKLARAYFQEKDPAKYALDALKQVFERHAYGFEYNKFQSMALPIDIWNLTEWDETGIYIEQNGKTTFRQDPRYNDLDTEFIKLQQEIKKQEKDLQAKQQITMLQDNLDRERGIAKTEFERQEKTKAQLYDICYNLRKVAAEEITAVLKERIHEGFERGKTASEISGEYFALLSIFEDAEHIRIENSIIAGMFVDGALVQNDEKQDADTDADDLSDTVNTEETEITMKQRDRTS